MPADSLRAVLDSVFGAPAYRWVEPVEPLAFIARWLDELERWLRGLRDANPLGYRLLLAGLAVALAAVLIHAVWVLLRTVRAGEQTPVPAPAAPPRGPAWYREEARRLAAQGRFAEAIQRDFLGLVLELDAARLVRFHPGKTPAEYAREAGLPDASRSELGELVRQLYGYAFARWPCGPEDYSRWRAHADPHRYARAH